MPELRIEYKCTDCEHGYVHEMVDRLMLHEFPGAAVSTAESAVDVISEIFMGTRVTRLAGLPNPESQVRIRAIIRDAIAQHKQIPVIVAAGPKKGSSGQIDLAELSAMRTLSCLQASVQPYYAPGFSFRVRLEDATGIFLEGKEAIPHMQRYCMDFIKLCGILNKRLTRPEAESTSAFPPASALMPILESRSAAPTEKFLAIAEDMTPAFREALVTGDDTAIARLGWRGGIANGWKSFLSDRYSKIYPTMSEDHWLWMGAKYLSATLAKSLLRMKGGDPSWCIDGNKNLEISFAPPAPGAPAISSRVYYRTMSTKHTKIHVPFWRGKGFFRLVEGELKMGLVPGTAKGNRYIPGAIMLSDGTSDPLKIEADLLEDTYQ
jgi:hypothetical protein